MSTDGAFSRPRLLPSLLGLVLIVMGLLMVGLGIKLASLGGSLYYLVAGIAIVVTGVLLLRGSSKALGLYAVVLFASTLWSLWEIGLDWWQLVPRLSLWFVVGLLLLLPPVRSLLVNRLRKRAQEQAIRQRAFADEFDVPTRPGSHTPLGREPNVIEGEFEHRDK